MLGELDAVDANRPSNVLDGLLAHIFETEAGMEDATHTSACVRKPAGRPWKVRSNPIKPPTKTAAAIRATTTSAS
jgi:hypothetical protein